MMGKSRKYLDEEEAFRIDPRIGYSFQRNSQVTSGAELLNLDDAIARLILKPGVSFHKVTLSPLNQRFKSTQNLSISCNFCRRPRASADEDCNAEEYAPVKEIKLGLIGSKSLKLTFAVKIGGIQGEIGTRKLCFGF